MRFSPSVLEMLVQASTVVSAVVVVNAKNIVHAAFSLLLTFFGVSGIYVLLGADFLSIVQIMVYVQDFKWKENGRR